MRNRGSVALAAWMAERDVGLASVAKRVGTGLSTVSRWRDGSLLPSPASRAALTRVCAIDSAAWDEAPPPVDTLPACVPAEPAVPTPAPVPADIESIKRLLQGEIQAALADLLARRDQPGDVRMKVSERALKALSQLDSIGDESEVTERRIVKTRAWRRLMDRIGEALLAHPQALADLAKAVEQWEVE